MEQFNDVFSLKDKRLSFCHFRCSVLGREVFLLQNQDIFRHLDSPRKEIVLVVVVN